MRQAKQSPRNRLRMYAVKQEVVDCNDLLLRASKESRQGQKAKESSASDSESHQQPQRSRRRQRRDRHLSADESRSHGVSAEKTAGRPKSTASDNRGKNGADDEGNSREAAAAGSSTTPGRHRIRTRFPKPSLALLAAAPSLGHPELRPGQRRYLYATASLYSLEGTRRALRDGCYGHLLDGLGRVGSSEESRKKYANWIYGHHKQLFETDPSIWRQARPHSVSATYSRRREDSKDSASAERCDDQSSSNSTENRESAAPSMAKTEPKSKEGQQGRPKTAACGEARRSHRARSDVYGRRKQPTHKGDQVAPSSPEKSESPKDLNKIMY